MGDTLRALYDRFYTQSEMTTLTEAVEANRALLRDRLATDDRKIVLRIVDDMSLMAAERSYDSFICGFKLAWRLALEMDEYEDERARGDGAGLRALDFTTRPR